MGDLSCNVVITFRVNRQEFQVINRNFFLGLERVPFSKVSIELGATYILSGIPR